MLIAAIFVIFPFCMVFATVSDIVSMTIANRVSVILVAAFVVLAPLTGMDWSIFGWHLVAGLIALFVTFSLFSIGAMGGGDAKLIAATSVWMGFSMLMLEYVVLTGVLGGLLTIAILSFRNSPFAILSVHLALFRNIADERAGIPYGIALGACGLMLFPKTSLAQWALLQVTAN